MNRALQLLLSILIVVLASVPAPAAERTVYLVNVGWHVGIALPVDNTLRRAMPEVAAFPGARFIEIGWGDRAFYQAENPGGLMALKAALTSTDAVIHLHGFTRPVAERFSRSEVLALTLSDREFAALFGYIHASFERAGADGASVMMGPGLYGGASQFYKATGEFHLMRTCNTWVAEAMAAAGLDLEPDGIITAGGVMDAARAAVIHRLVSK
jgi:uncharacterized protein (TIGR02117 family)